MISVTGYKTFKSCRRQWYYKNLVADGRVKHDAFRREVTLLSKVQTLSGLRGSVVDDVISRLLVTAINNRYAIRKDYFIAQALGAFGRQLEYARLQKYRDAGAVINNNPDFAALLEYELGEGITDDDICNAREDIVSALSNLLDNVEFIDYVKTAKYVISQRPLSYSFDRISINAVPDFIAFFDDKPPHIFDWKVHTYGTVSYDDQLVAYAIALYKVAHKKPHSDFPENLKKYPIYDYRLSEYQLLHKDRIKRDYDVTLERVEEFRDEMTEAIIEMHLAGAYKKYNAVQAQNFETTNYVEYCTNCPFQKICKTGSYDIRD